MNSSPVWACAAERTCILLRPCRSEQGSESLLTGPLLHGVAPWRFSGELRLFSGEVLECIAPEEHEEDMGNEKNGESLGENQGPENPDARVGSLLPRRALLRAP